MRPLALILGSVATLAFVGFSGPSGDVPPDPRFATITGACNEGENPQVQPNRVLMSRADHVEWREPSGRATQWVISPKDPEDWLFPEASYTGTQEAPATTPSPREDALADHPYGYNVTITCSDGSTEVIDPEIVIGDGEEERR